jgi:hypothetical protein
MEVGCRNLNRTSNESSSRITDRSRSVIWRTETMTDGLLLLLKYRFTPAKGMIAGKAE